MINNYCFSWPIPVRWPIISHFWTPLCTPEVKTGKMKKTEMDDLIFQSSALTKTNWQYYFFWERYATCDADYNQVVFLCYCKERPHWQTCLTLLFTRSGSTQVQQFLLLPHLCVCWGISNQLWRSISPPTVSEYEEAAAKSIKAVWLHFISSICNW